MSKSGRAPCDRSSATQAVIDAAQASAPCRSPYSPVRLVQRRRIMAHGVVLNLPGASRTLPPVEEPGAHALAQFNWHPVDMTSHYASSFGSAVGAHPSAPPYAADLDLEDLAGDDRDRLEAGAAIAQQPEGDLQTLAWSVTAFSSARCPNA
jgi:hypothetical protein